MRRWLWTLGGIALGLLSLYGIGANLFLRSPAAQRWMFRHPDRLQVTWEQAWTVWPGRVHLETVEIRGQDRRLQWWASLDRATVSVDLSALAWRTFHARSIGGMGVEVRLRHRLAPEASPPTGPDGTVLTPEIPGLDPWTGPHAPVSGGSPPDRRPGWTIHLEGVDLARLREVWIDRYRLAGAGRLRGSMELRVRGDLSVEQARIGIGEGRLTEGTTELLERVDLELGVHLDRFRPRDHHGLDFLRFVSGRLTLDTRTRSLGFLDPVLTQVPGLQLAGGGELRVDARLDHGQPAAGTRIELVPEGLALAFRGLEARGSGRLTGEIREGDPGNTGGARKPPPRTLLAARFDRFELQWSDDPNDRLIGRGLDFSAELDDLRLDRTPPPPVVEISLAALELPDLTLFAPDLEAVLPSKAGIRLRSGRGSVAAQGVLDAATGTGRGEVTLTTHALVLTGDLASGRRFDARGDLEAVARLSSFDLAGKSFEADEGRLRLTGFDLAGSTPTLAWRTRFDRLEAVVDPRRVRDRTLRVHRITGEGATVELDRDAGAARTRRARRSGGLDGWRLRLEDLDLRGIRELRFDRYRVRGKGRLAGSLDVRLGGALSADRVVVEMEDGVLLEDAENRKGTPETLLPRLAVRTDLSIEELLPGVAGPALPSHLSGTAHLETRTESFTLLNRFLSRIPELHVDGSGDLDLDLTLRKGRVIPGTRLTGTGALDLRFLDYRAHGTGRLSGRVEQRSESPSSPSTVLGIDLDRFALSWQGGPHDYVQGSGMQVVVIGPSLFLGGPLEMPDVRIAIDMPASEVPDLTVYGAMLPAGSGLRLISGHGTLAARASFDTATETGDADVTLRAHDLGARYGTTRLAGDFRLTTHIPRMQLRERSFVLDGTRLDIDRAVVAGEPTEAGWWMRVELPRSHLDLGTRPHLEAQIRASMRDSSPLTAYLESKKPLLRWIEGALTVENVTLTAGFEADSRLYRLRDARVTGRHLEILGEVRISDTDHDGLFHLSLGPLSAGFEMVGGKKDLKLFGSRKWFEEKRARW